MRNPAAKWVKKGGWQMGQTGKESKLAPEIPDWVEMICGFWTITKQFAILTAKPDRSPVSFSYEEGVCVTNCLF